MNLDNANTSSPYLWSWQLRYVYDEKPIEPEKLEIPDEFDFLKAFHGTYWPSAKDYYNGQKP